MAKKRKAGNGLIRQRADGRWEGRYVVGYDDHGYPKTKAVFGKSKRECAEKLAALKTQLGGKVPVVIVEHDDASDDIYGTITHNRARGTHLLEPMKAIVKRLLDDGKTVDEIGKQLGMKPEEVFRLSDFTREEFLDMMTKGVNGYSRAVVYKKI